jgi:hypothetical protein
MIMMMKRGSLRETAVFAKSGMSEVGQPKELFYPKTLIRPSGLCTVASRMRHLPATATRG